MLSSEICELDSLLGLILEPDNQLEQMTDIKLKELLLLGKAARGSTPALLNVLVCIASDLVAGWLKNTLLHSPLSALPSLHLIPEALISSILFK
jgi:hypothetical protein